jgi:carboxyl-terminal processing protease
VQAALAGPAGTKVKLSIERDDEHPVFALTRREIVFHPVQRADLNGGVAYIELATFSERAANELRRAIDSLRAQGARSLILDLRENPGGLLEQGIEVADLFLNRGQSIASTRGRMPESNQEFGDQKAEVWPDMPIVVLVDSGSASAAEIVAGALQDNRRAVLVGTPTYGKGSAQSIFPVADGYALKLTTARWFTPSGRSIERDSTAGGISPDVTVLRADTTTVTMDKGSSPTSATAPARRSAPSALAPPIAIDPVIAKAMELLEGVVTPEELRARVPKR